MIEQRPAALTHDPILPKAEEPALWLLLRVAGALVLGLAAVSLLIS